ncbi:hypothetical protein [Anaerotignum sp.]|nr:hypothetical protein [Anaerotignum sp.]MBP3306819.1 hypothetical protein [Anaerotignum sp.]MBP3628329.1 hypothetical protein [Anaerotignum sp.]
MNKLLLFMSIILSIACAMLAALFFSLRNKGLGIFVTGVGSVEPMTMIAVLMVLAVLFFVLAVKTAMKMKK